MSLISPQAQTRGKMLKGNASKRPRETFLGHIQDWFGEVRRLNSFCAVNWLAYVAIATCSSFSPAILELSASKIQAVRFSSSHLS